MDEKKIKEGVSVKELENFAKKHRYELFFCLAFILAGIFGGMIYGGMWLVTGAMVGGVIGVLLAGKVDSLYKSMVHFVFKHEQATQLVLGVVFLVIAIFLAPLIFLLLGMCGGKEMYQAALIGSAKKH